MEKGIQAAWGAGREGVMLSLVKMGRYELPGQKRRRQDIRVFRKKGKNCQERLVVGGTFTVLQVVRRKAVMGVKVAEVGRVWFWRLSGSSDFTLRAVKSLASLLSQRAPYKAVWRKEWTRSQSLAFTTFSLDATDINMNFWTAPHNRTD